MRKIQKMLNHLSKFTLPSDSRTPQRGDWNSPKDRRRPWLSSQESSSPRHCAAIPSRFALAAEEAWNKRPIWWDSCGHSHFRTCWKTRSSPENSIFSSWGDYSVLTRVLWDSEFLIVIRLKEFWFLADSVIATKASSHHHLLISLFIMAQVFQFSSPLSPNKCQLVKVMNRFSPANSLLLTRVLSAHECVWVSEREREREGRWSLLSSLQVFHFTVHYTRPFPSACCLSFSSLLSSPCACLHRRPHVECQVQSRLTDLLWHVRECKTSKATWPAPSTSPSLFWGCLHC